MTLEEEIINQLTNFGLEPDEIKKLTISNAFVYLKLYNKKGLRPSIAFIGFTIEEMAFLTAMSAVYQLTVLSRISKNLTFLCISQKTRIRNVGQIELAKRYGVTILSKEQFELIFHIGGNKTSLNELLFDTEVPSDFQIAKPLSNFNKDVKVRSNSFDSNNTYLVNIFKMICSCPDYEKKHRSQFNIGDIRRLCKHLRNEYKEQFGLYDTSSFLNYVFEINYSLERNLIKTQLENLNLFINYDDPDDWWSIIIQNEKKSYSKYGYNPIEKRFSYNDKPYGIVGPLKIKLNEIHVQVTGKRYPTFNSKKRTKKQVLESDSNQTSTGCIVLIILSIVITTIIYHVF